MNLKNLFAAAVGVIGVTVVAFLFSSPFVVLYMLVTQ